MMDAQQALEETERCFGEIKSLEALIRAQAQEHGIDPMMMRYSDGSMAMAPLVLAKSQLLPVLYDAAKEVEEEQEVEKIADWLEDQEQDKS